MRAGNPLGHFCPRPLIETGCGKCRRHPGPHGMNEGSLGDLWLLSRRSTSYRGRTDMRLEGPLKAARRYSGTAGQVGSFVLE